MQQALAEAGVLERFLDGDKCQRLRKCFTGLYSLGENEQNVGETVAKALQSPGDYVLKPQREGGGNNFYGEKLKEILSTASPRERSAYILMDRIRPPSTSTLFFREGQVMEAEGVSELGIYGVFLQ